MRRIKGQSTLEYVIILTAIIAAIVIGKTVINTAVQSNMTATAGALTNATAGVTF
ncbi:MAG: hypothetical protein Q8L26_03605 [Candidatus Omnitrophota bacterium]|nr:hypothetical protein [Candidatus Omnitrophota bacterium]